jgi:hypothetical protein
MQILAKVRQALIKLAVARGHYLEEDHWDVDAIVVQPLLGICGVQAFEKVPNSVQSGLDYFAKTVGLLGNVICSSSSSSSSRPIL